MELRAALEALRALEPSGEMVADRLRLDVRRQLLHATSGGCAGSANGWRNSNKQPVANADLWKPLVEFERTGNVEWGWVKGHSGDRLNDLVDGLAVAAIRR